MSATRSDAVDFGALIRRRRRAGVSHPGGPPRPELLADEAALLTWLATAQPRERLAYHVGHLAVDRWPGESPLPAALRQELVRVADRALALAEEGCLLLVQQRLNDRRTAYLVIKATAPNHGKEQCP